MEHEENKCFENEFEKNTIFLIDENVKIKTELENSEEVNLKDPKHECKLEKGNKIKFDSEIINKYSKKSLNIKNKIHLNKKLEEANKRKLSENNDSLNNVIKKKRIRRSLSLGIKLDILKRHEQGERPTYIARELSLAPTTVFKVVKNGDIIKSTGKFVNENIAKRLTRFRHPAIEKMEQQLLVWIKDQIQNNMPLSMPLMKNMALSLYNEIKNDISFSSYEIIDFKASNGWFDRFKTRVGLQLNEYSSTRSEKEIINKNDSSISNKAKNENDHKIDLKLPNDLSIKDLCDKNIDQIKLEKSASLRKESIESQKPKENDLEIDKLKETLTVFNHGLSLIKDLDPNQERSNFIVSQIQDALSFYNKLIYCKELPTNEIQKNTSDYRSSPNVLKTFESSVLNQSSFKESTSSLYNSTHNTSPLLLSNTAIPHKQRSSILHHNSFSQSLFPTSPEKHSSQQESISFSTFNSNSSYKSPNLSSSNYEGISNNSPSIFTVKENQQNSINTSSDNFISSTTFNSYDHNNISSSLNLPLNQKTSLTTLSDNVSPNSSYNSTFTSKHCPINSYMLSYDKV